MAAGFFAKTLSTLAASVARWVEFADGQQAPVHGAISIDPNTGLPIATALRAQATFTPGAASHDAGDVNGAAGTFAMLANTGGHIMITTVSLEIDGATAEASAWRLHLYNVTPPSALADSAVFDLPIGDRASYLGYVDLGTAVDLGSTQWVDTAQVNKHVKLAGTSLYGYLVNLTTLTPAAVAHIVTIKAVAL